MRGPAREGSVEVPNGFINPARTEILIYSSPFFFNSSMLPF